MTFKVIGVSGSPTPDSNTDELVKAVIEATGADSEFIKLSRIKVSPCIACRKCAYTNECVLDDDFKWLSKKLLEADALVIGSPVFYNSVTAYMKAFMERLYSLRHVKFLMQGKLAAAVAVGENTKDTIGWMETMLKFGGMEVVATITAYGNPGCFVCGPGEKCKYSHWNSVAKMMGPDNFFMKAYEGYLEALPDNDPFEHPSYKVLKHRNVRDEPRVMAQAVSIGQRMREVFEKKR